MMRMQLAVALCFVLIADRGARAQEAGFQVKRLAEPAPAVFSEEIRGMLAPEGFRISTSDGKPFMDVWLRKGIPATKPPGGAEGAVQFSFLAEGTLLGVVQYLAEGHDIRDQSIIKGAYTLRYGLQPIDGNHLGVSAFRDFGLLLPGEQDKTLAPPDMEALFGESAKVSGTEHPAAFMLFASKTDIAKVPSVRHDEEKRLWGVTLPANAEVKAGEPPTTFLFEIIVDGVAE